MAKLKHTARYEGEPLSPRSGGDCDVRILAVDDHRTFREVLTELVAAMPGFVLVGLACSGEEAVVGVGQLSPHMVLMDVTMPGMGGIAAARVILNRYSGIVVVLISIDDPTLDVGASELASVTCVRKQDLRPSELRRVWEMHQN